MNWHKFSPVFFTLLLFLLAQGVGTLLLLGIVMLISSDFRTAFQSFCSSVAQGLPIHELLPVSVFSLILIAVNILAVLCCHLFLHNIHFAATFNISSIKWRPGMVAILGGFLGALSISILTESVELPDVMLQMSQAMSHNTWGLLALVIAGPITEELLFREAIVGEMVRRGTSPWIAIIVSALAFSSLHLNFAQGLYALPLGIIFGIIYYKTGNIVLTSTLHILNNSIAAYQLNRDISDFSLSEWLGGAFNAYAALLLFAVLCFLLIKKFWETYPMNEIGEETEKKWSNFREKSSSLGSNREV